MEYYGDRVDTAHITTQAVFGILAIVHFERGKTLAKET
jgi:hypothetical protein